MSRAPELPGATGVVRFSRTVGGGTGIDIRAKRLSDPERQNPPGYAYVAWVRGSREEPAGNIGALQVAADRSGELRAVTPLRRFELFVTAEATADAEKPTGRRLLWTDRK